jgi:hypothetical protein
MTDYNYAKIKMNEEINNAYDFDIKLKMMCYALDISPTNNDGKFKDMETYLGDIAVAYLKYQREVNEMKFCYKKYE